jgi:cell division protein FtsL
MEIDKLILHKIIEAQLAILVSNATQAAMQAHETATHEENKAENKYDTLGLEASYLAEGQAKRVAQLESDLLSFKRLQIKYYKEDMAIGLGAVVCLRTEINTKKYVFISPVAGGVSFHFQDLEMILITETSPLGKAIKNKYLGDEIMIKQAFNSIQYDIEGLW